MQTCPAPKRGLAARYPRSDGRAQAFHRALYPGSCGIGRRGCLSIARSIRGKGCASATSTELSSMGSALLGQLGSLGTLASLAGSSLGLKDPADMYVSFLTSRTVEDAVIRRFGLMAEFAKSECRTHERIRAAHDGGCWEEGRADPNTVEDSNPKRAADLANGYVEELRKLSASLAITEAARRRLFFEQQLQQAKDNLAVAEDAMKKTQRSTGVLQIDSQARALIESAAVLHAQVVAKQVQIQSMRSFAAEDNPRLVLAKQELAALQTQLERVAGSQHDTGSDINLSKGRVTESGMEYLNRFRDLKYNETVFELLAKEFEMAKLDEAREGSIIQVVDAAVPRQEVISAPAPDSDSGNDFRLLCRRLLDCAPRRLRPRFRTTGKPAEAGRTKGGWRKTQDTEA